MAEGILRSKIEEQNLDVFIDSSGTSDYHIGENPDIRAVQKCADYGIDISKLQGRQLILEDFTIFDRIFVMDSSNYQNAISLTNNQELRAKIEMILNLNYPGENRSVPDPYFGGEEGFEQVYQLLENACDTIIDQIKNG
jgi:protein-tyrosine phosphatase